MKTLRITVDAEYDEDDFDDDEHLRFAINHQLALRGIDAKFVHLTPITGELKLL